MSGGEASAAGLGVWTVPGAAVAVALLAQLSVPLPGSPVPVTGQTLGVLLAGALLGSARGVAAVALYLAAGLAGLPVFAGGEAGLHRLLGPTGGYLVGFLAAAWIAGRLVEAGWGRSLPRAFAAMVAAHAAVFAAGVPWLAASAGVGRALAGGLYPFLPGVAVKSAVAAGVAWAVTPKECRASAAAPPPGPPEP